MDVGSTFKKHVLILKKRTASLAFLHTFFFYKWPDLLEVKFLILQFVHANPEPALYKKRQMRKRMYFLSRLRSCTHRPIRRRLHVDRRVKCESGKTLQQPDEEEGSLVVRELLPKADPRSGIEGTENERVGHQVFLHPFIKEPIWVEFNGIWSPKVGSTMEIDDSIDTIGLRRNVPRPGSIFRGNQHRFVGSPDTNVRRRKTQEVLKLPRIHGTSG